MSEEIKIQMLKYRIPLPRYQLIGLIEGMRRLSWSMNITRMSYNEIGACLEYPGDPAELLDGLLNAGFIEYVGEDNNDLAVCEDAFILKKPKRGKKKKTALVPAPSKTSRIWAAYSSAYYDRYSVDPVRNAKVSKMLAMVIDRLGVDEGPNVARYYVLHNKSFYVNARHCVDMLLRDCEGLRMEWATGRQVTDASSRQLDKKEANRSVLNTLLQEAGK